MLSVKWHTLDNLNLAVFPSRGMYWIQRTPQSVVINTAAAIVRHAIVLEGNGAVLFCASLFNIISWTVYFRAFRFLFPIKLLLLLAILMKENLNGKMTHDIFMSSKMWRTFDKLTLAVFPSRGIYWIQRTPQSVVINTAAAIVRHAIVLEGNGAVLSWSCSTMAN